MEPTTERHDQPALQPRQESDAELSATFRAWAKAMSATQIRHLLSHCSAEGLAEYSRQNELLGHDSHRTWRLLKAALVNRLQVLTAPADPDEIRLVRQWADALTPQESVHILMYGSPETYSAYLQARQVPPLSDLHRVWALFEAELLARTESLNTSRGTAGTA
ncbi:MAG: hypothetical protein OJF52_004250 [Nitrospira sp.]|jgi:hypothetical protein|nr:MAG: hypothetical protein OJF52_004250 [Nitrospira sp.]